MTRIIIPAGVAAFIASLVFAACSAALPPPARVLCEAAAQQRAQSRVDAECTQDAGPCATKDSILAQLKTEQEQCQ